MISEQEYRKALYRKVVINLMTDCAKHLDNARPLAEHLSWIVDTANEYAQQCLEIERADFQDNFNPDHAQEQGRPF